VNINPQKLISDLMQKLHRGIIWAQSPKLEQDLWACVEEVDTNKTFVVSVVLTNSSGAALMIQNELLQVTGNSKDEAANFACQKALEKHPQFKVELVLALQP